MSVAHDRKDDIHTLSLPPLSPVSEIITKVSSEAQNQVESNRNGLTNAELALHPHVASPASSDSQQASPDSQHDTLQLNGAAQPPNCGRTHSQPSFRLERVSAIQEITPVPLNRGVSVQTVYDAIVKKAPHASVVHVHDANTSAAPNLISINSPRDFSKGFTPAVPSFILVDACEQSISLAVEMLRNQAGKIDGAVIVFLLECPAALDFGLLIEKVPVFIASGADDVSVIPRDATNVHLSVSVSLAKAQASREQRIKLKRQIQASKKQCHRLFWEIVHELCPDFPEVQPQLREIRQKLVGNMVFVRRLGEGAFGTVYKWENRARQGSGAVKVYPKEGISSAEQVSQIATEFAVSQRLDHRNVVRVHQFLHGMQSVYLFMEMAGTRNLFQMVRAAEGARGLPWSIAEGFILQVGAGVAHCHKMRVAHCDLKPENIVISDSDCVKIVDFGHAVDLVETVAPLKHILGTMPFVAPEILLYCADWQPSAADIWSFAVIIIEMLCGNHAFVRLLDWESHHLGNVAQVTQRADELKTFFAKDERGAHANALVAIFDLCGSRPPPCVLQLLGDMLEIVPKNRIGAESVVECIQKIVA